MSDDSLIMDFKIIKREGDLIKNYDVLVKVVRYSRLWVDFEIWVKNGKYRRWKNKVFGDGFLVVRSFGVGVWFGYRLEKD